MTPRALALQGAGFGARALATQGLQLGADALNREVAVQGVGYGLRSTALQGLYPRGVDLPQIVRGTGGRAAFGKSRRATVPVRRDRDDDVLMFLLR